MTQSDEKATVERFGRQKCTIADGDHWVFVEFRRKRDGVRKKRSGLKGEVDVDLELCDRSGSVRSYSSLIAAVVSHQEGALNRGKKQNSGKSRGLGRGRHLQSGVTSLNRSVLNPQGLRRPGKKRDGMVLGAWGGRGQEGVTREKKRFRKI